VATPAQLWPWPKRRQILFPHFHAITQHPSDAAARSNYRNTIHPPRAFWPSNGLLRGAGKHINALTHLEIPQQSGFTAWLRASDTRGEDAPGDTGIA